MTVKTCGDEPRRRSATSQNIVLARYTHSDFYYAIVLQSSFHLASESSQTGPVSVEFAVS